MTTLYEPKERDKKLKELLNKSFGVIRVKTLRPAIMTILRNMTQIDDKYLRVLVRDRELYSDTDTEVKVNILLYCGLSKLKNLISATNLER